MPINNNDTELPQNITIHVAGDNERSFFDRHFGALLGAGGVVAAALVAGAYSQNETTVDLKPEFALVTPEPTLGEPVRFTVNESGEASYRLRIAQVEGDAVVATAEATSEQEGMFYVWTPSVIGPHVAKLTLEQINGRQSGKSILFNVAPVAPTDPVANTAAVIEVPEEPERQSQTFAYAIGNPGSCTEKNVTRSYNVCLAPDFEIVDWKGRYQSERNGTAAMERDPSRANCAILTLSYSDSGLGILGDCKGNGWVDYAVTLNGIRKP